MARTDCLNSTGAGNDVHTHDLVQLLAPALRRGSRRYVMAVVLIVLAAFAVASVPLLVG